MILTAIMQYTRLNIIGFIFPTNPLQKTLFNLVKYFLRLRSFKSSPPINVINFLREYFTKEQNSFFFVHQLPFKKNTTILHILLWHFEFKIETKIYVWFLKLNDHFKMTLKLKNYIFSLSLSHFYGYRLQ